MDVYAVPLIKSNRTTPITFEQFCFGNPSEEADHRTILVLGANNSSSQAKFINGIINFIFNIEQEDTFRFQVMEETVRNKNCVSVYDIHHAKGFRIPYSLTIAVIPYLLEDSTGQLFKDQKVAEIFQEFLEDIDGIKELDMICNVMVHTDTNQSFLPLLGKDTAESINYLQPFNYLEGDTSWKELNQGFFDMLTKKTTKSMLLTKQVLKERKKIDDAVIELESLIKIGHEKTEAIEKAKQTVVFCETQFNDEALDNFVVELTQKLELPSGQYVTNCNHCYATCYSSSPFVFMEENEELNCCFNLSDLHRATIHGFCSVCPEKCSMSVHSNQPYRWVSVKKETMILPDRTTQRNRADMKWRDIKSKGQDAINSLQKDLMENGTVMLEQFKRTWLCIQNINEMALNGNSFLTQRVFDFLFDAEQQLKQLGFELQYKFST